MSFEDRLAERLADDAQRQPLDGLKSLPELQSAATRRTRRKRVGIGFVASVALVGVGLFGANNLRAGDTADSTRIATESREEAGVDEAGVDESLDERDEQATAGGSSDGESRSRPSGAFELDVRSQVSQVVTTDSGYAAFVDSAEAISVMTSSDGVNWTAAPTSLVAGSVISADHRDGLYVVVGLRANDTFGRQQQPFAATSTDLAEWSYTTLAYDGAVPEGRRMSIYADVIAIGDNGVLVGARVSADPDLEAIVHDLDGQRYCQPHWSDDRVTVVDCETGISESVEIASAGSVPSAVFWHSDGTSPFVVVHDPLLDDLECDCTFVGYQGGDFVVHDPVAGRILRSSDGVAWRAEPGGQNRTQFFGQGAMAARGDEVVLANPVGNTLEYSPDRGRTWSSPVSLDELVEPSLGTEVSLDRITAGEAGWVATAYKYAIDIPLGDGSEGAIVGGPGNPAYEIKVDGYTISGSFMSDSSTVVADDGSFSHLYEPPADDPLGLPEDVVDGFFSGRRFLRPGTDEVLVTVTPDTFTQAAQDAQSANYEPFPTDAIADYEVDGWRLAGSIMRGPLELTDPSGVTKVFDDGFAFGNGSPSDGVEIDPPLSGQNDPSDDAADIVFFGENGNELVRFPFWGLIESMVSDEAVAAAPPILDPADLESIPTFTISRNGYTLEASLAVGSYTLFDAGGELLAETERSGTFGAWPELPDWVRYDGVGGLEVTDPRTGELALYAAFDELSTAPDTLLFFSSDGVSWSLVTTLPGLADVTIDGDQLVVVSRDRGTSTSAVIPLD